MKEITKNKTFEQKMMDKVKDSIGDLMSDEDLKKIVDKGIEEVFFKPKERIKGSGYHAERKILPSLIDDMLRDLLKERVKKAAEDYIADNADTLKIHLDKIVEDGIANAVITSLNAAFNSSLEQFQFGMTAQIESMLMNRNL